MVWIRYSDYGKQKRNELKANQKMKRKNPE